MSSDVRTPSTPPPIPARPEGDRFERADRLPIGRFLVWFVGGLAVVVSLAALADADTGAAAPAAASSAAVDRTP